MSGVDALLVFMQSSQLIDMIADQDAAAVAHTSRLLNVRVKFWLVAASSRQLPLVMIGDQVTVAAEIPETFPEGLSLFH